MQTENYKYIPLWDFKTHKFKFLLGIIYSSTSKQVTSALELLQFPYPPETLTLTM